MKYAIHSNVVYNDMLVFVLASRQVDGVWYYDVGHIDGIVRRGVHENSLTPHPATDGATGELK